MSYFKDYDALFSWLHLGLCPEGYKGLFPLHFLRNREGANWLEWRASVLTPAQTLFY